MVSIALAAGLAEALFGVRDAVGDLLLDTALKPIKDKMERRQKLKDTENAIERVLESLDWQKLGLSYLDDYSVIRALGKLGEPDFKAERKTVMAVALAMTGPSDSVSLDDATQVRLALSDEDLPKFKISPNEPPKTDQ